MKSGPFIELASDAYGVPVPTVRQYARDLKEVGLFTSGARGKNAPDITPLDTARITIAMLTTASPKAAPDLVRSCGQFVQKTSGEILGIEATILESDLAMLLASTVNFDIAYHQDAHNFLIYLGLKEVVYNAPDFWKDREAREWTGGIRLTRTLSAAELYKLQALFNSDPRKERGSGA